MADANEQICIATACIVPDDFRADQFVDLRRNALVDGIQALAMSIGVAVRAAEEGAGVYGNGEIMFVRFMTGEHSVRKGFCSRDQSDSARFMKNPENRRQDFF